MLETISTGSALPGPPAVLLGCGGRRPSFSAFGPTHMPHLCNLRRARFEISEANALEATLDALASGVYLTDRTERVVYMNSAAEQHIKASKVLRIVGIGSRPSITFHEPP